ncbi:MAG: hypothetical protein IV086_06300 [Hyphomonadaceae bacterium]|nr:MAG: ETC complex subunit I [Caulobacteraceae bacterium]MBT9445292.1 hypothetical protein [Hyphomonadaceae bacterium]TPW07766.1 MAG: ETC complex subunit I [Alphaproteobacteria bacterium]
MKMPNFDEKLRSPETAYETPLQVVHDNALSTDEKRRVLDAWRRDAEGLAEAANEGMAGGEPSRLREVALAQGLLDPPPAV